MSNHPPLQVDTEEGSSQGGARIVDVLCLPYTQQRVIGIGSVHHVAFRTPTDAQQQVLLHKLVKAGLNATTVRPVLLSFLISP
jgi:hypothetical protein